MPGDRFDRFSALLLELYQASSERPLEEFQDTALELIKPLLPFDGAMWGTATFREGVGIDIHTIHLHNQSPEMITEYEHVKHLDTSAALVTSSPLFTRGFHSPSWFDGGAKWDDYRDWQRRHGHENVFITASTHPQTGSSQWFSLFRADNEQVCRPEEVELLAQITPHVMQALRQNLARHLEQGQFLSGDPSLDAGIADPRGVIHYASPGFEAQLRAEFGAQLQGNRLPSVLMDWVRSRTDPFIGRTLAAMHGVRKDLLFIRLRPLCLADGLAPRQREAAELMARGLTHKETAQKLGRAPATVRNQMQEVYRKLGVNSVAALAQALIQAKT